MRDTLELTPIMMYYSTSPNVGLVMDPTTDLETMAVRALARWPELAYAKGGSRAHKAADLVRDEAVVYLGESTTGVETWLVGEHLCSLTGRTCQCEDRLAQAVPDYGRLCKHRLAAYFQVALDRIHLRRLERILLRAETEVALEVRVYYKNDLHLQLSKLAGFRADDQAWESLGHEDEINFRVRDLEVLMFRYGWKIAPGRRLVVGRHYGGRERWFLEPLPDADRVKGSRIATAVESLYGRDVATVEDHARERRLKRMFQEELEHTAA